MSGVRLWAPAWIALVILASSAMGQESGAGAAVNKGSVKEATAGDQLVEAPKVTFAVPKEEISDGGKAKEKTPIDSPAVEAEADKVAVTGASDGKANVGDQKVEAPKVTFAAKEEISDGGKAEEKTPIDSPAAKAEEKPTIDSPAAKAEEKTTIDSPAAKAEEKTTIDSPAAKGEEKTPIDSPAAKTESDEVAVTDSSDGPANSGEIEESSSAGQIILECTSCANTHQDAYTAVGMDYYNDDSSDVDESEVLYQDIVIDKWSRCGSSPSMMSASDCHVDDRYTGTVRFHALYKARDGLRLTEPTVKVLSGSAAKPIVAFIDDSKDFTSYIRVEYNCEASEEEDINLLELVTGTKQKPNAFKIRWLKVCGGGVYDKIVVGFKSHDEDAKERIIDENEDLVVVPSNDASTTIFMRLAKPALLQHYEAPQITVDRDEELIGISIRGDGATAGDLNRYGVEFEVNYFCRDAISGIVEFRLAIPPFEDIVRRWKKDCAESSAVAEDYDEEEIVPEGASEVVEEENEPRLKMLNIGTGYYESDVMDSGETQVKFDLRFEEGLRYEDFHMRVPENETEVDFFVSNPSESSSLHIIDQVSLTVQDKNVLAARVVSPSYSTSSISKYGGKIEPGQSSKLSIHIICKMKGTSSVLVSLASLYQEKVEFGFVKNCKQPIRHVERGTFRTANSLLRSLFFLSVLLGGLSIYFYKKRLTRVPYRPFGAVL